MAKMKRRRRQEPTLWDVIPPKLKPFVVGVFILIVAPTLSNVSLIPWWVSGVAKWGTFAFLGLFYGNLVYKEYRKYAKK